MSDETATGPAGTPDGGGHPQRGRSEPAPLQSRAKFLQNWDWQSVSQIHAGLCERGHAQQGVNAETHEAVAKSWKKAELRVFSVASVISCKLLEKI
jgi:hypothetical protein